MRRLWLGVGLLAVLLGISLFVTAAMDHVHEPISEKLEAAANAAAAGNWDEATALADQAQKEWRRHWHFSAAVADHEPMEEIDACFGELEMYTKTKDTVKFCGSCARLSKLTNAMGDSHDLSWWNML